MRRWQWVLLVLAGTALVSCGGGAEPDGELVVTMFDNRFGQDEYTVPVGATVTFVNDGRNPHNAVDAAGAWSTEETFGTLAMAGGDATSLTFDEPGTYPFVCTFHSTGGEGMVATLVVGDGVAAAVTQDEPPEQRESDASGVIREVPTSYPTIQNAVDAAQPGDLILVQPGVYREQVNVTTDRIVIRGADRNETIIDAEMQRDHGINIVADGVAVENLTARNALVNGVFWNGVAGLRGSYLTAHDNGDYGIYAFDSSDGLIEHSYASGSPDGGYYVGQCDPCRIVLTDNVAEYNAFGFSGTNASGDMYLINSIWRHNGAGIVPNTLDSELLAPFHDVTIIGNLIHDNDNRDVPWKNATWPAFGNGIFMAGGNSSLVTENTILNHAGNGVVIGPNLDKRFWISHGNTVVNNTVLGSGRADLALAGPAGDDNCFGDNRFESSLPVGLEVFQGCDGGLRLPWRFALAATTEPLGRIAENGTGTRPDNPMGSVPRPGPQPQMPGGAGAEVRPAVDVFASFPIDLDISRPDIPPEVTLDTTKGITVFGLLLQTGGWSIYFGLWAYLMPFMLFGALLAIVLWDLIRRDDISKGAMILWVAVALLVPFVGVIAYFIGGRSEIPAWRRATIVAGGLGAYLALLAIGSVVGGIV